jgi:hypothetical protein
MSSSRAKGLNTTVVNQQNTLVFALVYMVLVLFFLSKRQHCTKSANPAGTTVRFDLVSFDSNEHHINLSHCHQFLESLKPGQ